MRAHRRLVDRIARPHLPRRTVRLRLTLIYSALFLICGIALLAITYLLVARATDTGIYRSGNLTIGTVGGHNGAHSTPSSETSGTGNPPRGAPLITPAQAEKLAHQQHAALLHQLLLQSGLALAITTVVSIGLGWLLAGRVLRPLRTITGAVRDISETNLHRRLALAGPNDELKELGDTFDGLLTRLDASFQAQRRFIANASHELRTPLARQRTLGQVALADPDATIESLRAAHERVLAAGARQERVIDALLTLARGQAGTDRHDAFDLAGLTRQILTTRKAEATSRHIDLHTSLQPAPASGEPRLVERLIANLIDNGLRHNHANGHLDIRTVTRDGRALLTVTNTGPDIPPHAVEQLFQPFRRLNTERVGDGLGLGLSIVKAIADAHHATTTAQPRPHGGLTIEIGFPARSPNTPRQHDSRGEPSNGAHAPHHTQPSHRHTTDTTPTPRTPTTVTTQPAARQ
jgi:signal transduction histidine kinase